MHDDVHILDGCGVIKAVHVTVIILLYISEATARVFRAQNEVDIAESTSVAPWFCR